MGHILSDDSRIVYNPRIRMRPEEDEYEKSIKYVFEPEEEIQSKGHRSKLF